MTCPLCETDAAERDLRNPCCAARHIEKATRDDAARLLSQVAHKWGHDRDDLRRRIKALRRQQMPGREDAPR